MMQTPERCFLERHARSANWGWGYIVYRTVYTPESDELWSSITAKLESYVFREISRPLSARFPGSSSDPAECKEVRDHLVFKYMDNKALYDRLSLDDLRAGYRKHRKVRFKPTAFLVIDEEVLHSIRDAPEPDSARSPAVINNQDCALYQSG
jgi:hypothetical protein